MTDQTAPITKELTPGKKPGKFNMHPLGSGEVTGVLHKGGSFRLFRAKIGERDVVIKTPSPFAISSNIFVKSIFQSSETFYRTERGIDRLASGTPDWLRLDNTIITSILMAEAQLINQSAGAWNHEIIAISSWDGYSQYWHDNWWKDEGESPEPLAMRFYPVIVMPYYPAVTFSSLPNSAKRLLFPKMLPAFRNALSAMPHGDLSEENILINQTKNIFHLIDPGVAMTSYTNPESSHPMYSIFTTTAANYPLIPPFNHTPANGAGLANYLKNLFTQAYEGSQPGVGNNRSQPAACDLLALGIIYYRILTGKEIFSNIGNLAEESVWMINYRTPAWEDRGIYRLVSEALESGYLQKELAGANISKAERNLAYSLLDLDWKN